MLISFILSSFTVKHLYFALLTLAILAVKVKLLNIRPPVFDISVYFYICTALKRL